MKKKFDLKVIAEIAIFAAIGYVLDYFQGAITGNLFPNGGSFGIAMIAVFIIAYRRGPVCGIITGLIMGLLDLLDGFYAISDTFLKVFAQLMLDYVIAYPLVGLAGLFKKKIDRTDTFKSRVGWIVLGCFVGSFGKFLAHFLSGVLFWPSDKWGGPFMYSLLYNGLYMLPCFVLSTVVMVLIAWKQPQLMNEKVAFTDKNVSIEKEENL